MSRLQYESIQCPKCGRESRWEYWTSVNSTIDPELKTRLIKDELTTFHCEQCGHSASVGADLLYHDMDRGLMLWLKYADERGEVELGPPSDSLHEEMPGYQFRIVGAFPELVERIKIFDGGYDDLTMEVFKLLVGVRQDVDLKNLLLYDETLEDSAKGRSLAFLEITEQGEQRHVIAMEPTYTQAQELAERLRSSLQSRQGKWLWFDRRSLLAEMLDEGWLGED